MEVKKNNKAASQPAAGKETNMPLTKTNFLLMGACLALIIIGFALMAGSPNEGATFNYKIFDTRRIVIGPLFSFIGFVLMAFAIIYRKKDKSGKKD